MSTRCACIMGKCTLKTCTYLRSTNLFLTPIKSCLFVVVRYADVSVLFVRTSVIAKLRFIYTVSRAIVKIVQKRVLLVVFSAYPYHIAVLNC